MSKSKDKLVGRVKKVVKKSRRKLSEDKFERELQRTINFLSELQVRLAEAAAKPKDAPPKAPRKKTVTSSQAEKKTAAKAPAAQAAAKAAPAVAAKASPTAKKTRATKKAEPAEKADETKKVNGDGAPA